MRKQVLVSQDIVQMHSSMFMLTQTPSICELRVDIDMHIFIVHVLLNLP